jgi:hypothetical protein
LEFGHPAPNSAPIDFKLGLTRAPGADPATKTRECDPASREPGQPVDQLRQLHLEASFSRSRPLSEYVEDEGGPVDDAHFQSFFQISLLRWTKLAVDNNQVRPFPASEMRKFLELSLPQERCWMRPLARLRERSHDHGVGRICQPRQLLEGSARRLGPVLKANKNCSLLTDFLISEH